MKNMMTSNKYRQMERVGGGGGEGGKGGKGGGEKVSNKSNNKLLETGNSRQSRYYISMRER